MASNKFGTPLSSGVIRGNAPLSQSLNQTAPQGSVSPHPRSDMGLAQPRLPDGQARVQQIEQGPPFPPTPTQPQPFRPELAKPTRQPTDG
jgi:hypothetical protein